MGPDAIPLKEKPKSKILKNRSIRVQSLIWEDPLEKGMTTHSNVLAWKIPWTEEPGRLQPMGSQSQIGLKGL